MSSKCGTLVPNRFMSFASFIAFPGVTSGARARISRACPLFSHTSPRVYRSHPRAALSTHTRRERDAWPLHELEVLPPSVRPLPTETLDLILRAKVFLLQSRRGYRANTDSLVLSYFAWHALRPRASRVVDLGTGSGLIPVLLGLRAEGERVGLRVDGVELQQGLCARARRNFAINALVGCAAHHVDIARGLPEALQGVADVVTINPPFYVRGVRAPPLDEEKRVAHEETTAGIVDFLRAAKAALRPGGRVCLVHDVAQRARVLQACAEAGMGVERLREVMHDERRSTGRFLLMASVGKSELCEEPLCLHPPGCPANRYGEGIEEFLAALRKPMYAIGRTGYVGSGDDP